MQDVRNTGYSLSLLGFRGVVVVVTLPGQASLLGMDGSGVSEP